MIIGPIAMDQNGHLPGSEVTGFTPPHSASLGPLQEPVGILTEIPTDLTSEDVDETAVDIILESPSSVIASKEVSMETEGMYGKDIEEDNLEVAKEVGDSVTQRPFHGILVEVEDKNVLGTAEEVPVVEKDIFEIIADRVGVSDSEVIQEATPQGEEPPSEVVAKEVVTEATVVVLAKPTVTPSKKDETQEKFGQEINEAPSQAVKIQDTIVNDTVGLEMNEIPDKALDSTSDIVSAEIGEEHSETTNLVPGATELAAVVVLGESEGETQKPPAERPSGNVVEDETKISADATPTVLLITEQDFEEAEILRTVTPAQESVSGVDIGPFLLPTDSIAVEDSNDFDRDQVSEEKPTPVAEVTSEPLIMILPNYMEENISPITETPPSMSVGEIIDEDTSEEKPEEQAKAEVKHEEASLVIEGSTTKAVVKEHATEATKTSEEEPVEAAVETAEEELTVAEETEEASVTREPVEHVEESIGLVDAKESEVVQDTLKVTEHNAESTKPLGRPAQEVEPARETDKKTDPNTEPAHEVEPEEETPEVTVKPATEAESIAQHVEESAELTGQEPEQEIPTKTQQTTTEEPQAPEDIEGVSKEQAPSNVSEVVTKEDRTDPVIPSLDKMQEAAPEERLLERGEATFEEKMEEEHGAGEERSHPDVTLIPQMFDETTTKYDEAITPLIVAAPEETEGLLPESGMGATPGPEVNVEVPRNSDEEVQPETIESTTEAVEPTSVVSGPESSHEFEKEIIPEAPLVISSEVVSDPEATAKASQEIPDAPVLDSSHEEAIVPVAVVPTEAELISPNVTPEDTEEFETVVEVTAESEEATTVDVTEESTPVATLEVTPKYVVEYNNGNFPDLTESPYSVDDNLRGNDNFGMDDEEENSVRLY